MAYSTEVLADSPALYLRLGEASGTTAVDSSTNGRNGTFQNAPTLGVTGLLTNDTDKACEFDGVDQYVSVPGWAGLGGTGGKTLEVWFKTSNSGALISWGDDSGNERYELAIRPAGDELQMRFLSGGFAGYQAAFGTFDDNVTHHVIVTWPDAGQIQDVVFYIDGAKQGSNASNGSLSINLTNSDPLRIGDGFASNFNGPLDGVLDEVSIYESEFTIGAINRHYLAGKDQITPFVSAMLATNPRIYYRLGETSFGSGLAEDDSGYGLDGDHYTPANCSSVTGAVVGDADTATDFSSPSGIEMDSNISDWDSITEASLQALVKIDNSATTGRAIAAISPALSGGQSAMTLWIDDFGRPRASAHTSETGTIDVLLETNLVGTGWHHIAATYEDSGELKLYLDGSEVASTFGAALPLFMTGWTDNGEGPTVDTVFVGHWFVTSQTTFIDGELDEWAMHTSVLTPAQIASIATATGITFSTPYNEDIAITWDIREDYEPQIVYIIWNIGATFTPAPIAITWDLDATYTPDPIGITWDIGQTYSPNSIGITWSIPQEAHFTASSASWGLSVFVGTVDVSASLVDVVAITGQESASTICNFSVLISAGPIDPSDWENKPVTIAFIGYESGSIMYQVREFTGITDLAEYDPEQGVMKVQGTTDLQGYMEAQSRESIDSSITSAHWSEHVFDDTADGWRYAQDRISTRPAEMHIDREGFFRVVDWAAKGSADIELSESGLYIGSFALTRASRRDLVNKIRVNMDFRFTRLRQREVGVTIRWTTSFCEFLISPWNALQRSQVESAADSGGWERIGDITFQPFPPAQGFTCVGTGAAFNIGWSVGGVDLSGICLGASWKAGRRWAQTVTETAVLEVTGSDSIDSVGEFGYDEDYGIESEFDSTGWETTSFNDRRSGITIFPSGDIVDDEDQITEQSRTDYEAAQTAAIAKAKTTILGRHRTNRLRFEAEYRPDIDLNKTMRVNTAYMKATGKVAGYDKTFNVGTGELKAVVTLALSRHGGSGLATDDPLDPVDTPDAPEESEVVRHLSLGYYIGGDKDSPPQSPDWTGFITNRQNPPDPGKVYQQGLIVEYPEIEDTARAETTVSATKTIDLAIPQDELTMSA